MPRAATDRRAKRKPTPRFASCVTVGVLLLMPFLAACVTEMSRSSSSRGVPVPASGPRPSAGGGQRSMELPNGPVARPADPGSTITTHVQVAIKPFGTVDYDGQTLPVVSPDGRFIAVQSGDAPTWEVTLGEPGSSAPASTFLAAYSINEGDLTRVQWAQSPPPGLLLGRSADNQGVLVESPRPDGARWIGRLDWVTGRVQWLIQGEACNSQAVLTSRGELLFTRISAKGTSADLVLRDQVGREFVKAAASDSKSDGRADARYWFPACTNDDSYVYAVLQTAAGLELEAIRVVRDKGAGGNNGALNSGGGNAPKLGAVIARRRVVDQGDGVMAAQMMSAVLPPHPAREGTTASDRLIFFHPALQRACAFDVDASAWRVLASNTIAGAPGVGVREPGYFCATPKGIVFNAANADRTVRVINGNYVPRGYSQDPPSLTLVGQIQGRPDQLGVYRLFVGFEDGATDRSKP